MMTMTMTMTMPMIKMIKMKQMITLVIAVLRIWMALKDGGDAFNDNENAIISIPL